MYLSCPSPFTPNQSTWVEKSKIPLISTYPETSIIRHIFHIISQPPQKISDECSTLNSRHYKPLSVPDALRLYKAFGINTEQRQSGKHCVYHSPYYRHIPIAVTSFGTGAPLEFQPFNFSGHFRAAQTPTFHSSKNMPGYSFVTALIIS